MAAGRQQSCLDRQDPRCPWKVSANPPSHKDDSTTHDGLLMATFAGQVSSMEIAGPAILTHPQKHPHQAATRFCPTIFQGWKTNIAAHVVSFTSSSSASACPVAQTCCVLQNAALGLVVLLRAAQKSSLGCTGAAIGQCPLPSRQHHARSESDLFLPRCHSVSRYL